MEQNIRVSELGLPLQIQFAMRKMRMEAEEMTWDQLLEAFLALYQKRLVEWAAIKDMLADENIELEFDIPTQMEIQQITSLVNENKGEDEDDNKEFSFV
jgi:hypothetical protein